MRTILITLIISANLFSQSLQSIYNSVLALGNKSDESSYSIMSETDKPNVKCGFGIIFEAKNSFNQFSTSQQKIITEILSRPVNQTSIVSPSGIFRIHFDTTGIQTPNYFPGVTNNIQLSIDSLAIAFDSSYNFEINFLGYESPPDDEGDGGDDLYDIYVTYLRDYGYTDWEDRSDNKIKSWIVVDKDMDFYTKGINAARVTAAHEFHHAIQVGSYRPPLTGDVYYHEITSTSMEEFVFDDMNDYYNYITGYFNNPDRRFTYYSKSAWGGGYDRAHWNIYLKEKFEREENDFTKGFEIIKKSWEIMRNHSRSAIESISLALSENGHDMTSSFNDFGAWCYFTGHRAQDDKYFKEASEYPLIEPIQDPIKYQPPKKTYIMSIQPVANNYMIFDLSYTGINDTLASIVTNGDVMSAATDPYSSIDYEYSLMTNPEDGATHIVNEYYSKLTSDQKVYLAEGDIFNDQVVRGSTIPRGELEYVYPQPYSYYAHSDISLAIPVKSSSSEYANLYIYTISMNLAYSDKLEINNSGRIMVLWNGLDNNGNQLPSGIYIYVTETEGQILKGKLAIIND